MKKDMHVQSFEYTTTTATMNSMKTIYPPLDWGDIKQHPPNILFCDRLLLNLQFTD